MQCKCGAETKTLRHEVTTDDMAQQWGADTAPIIVVQIKCPSCGMQLTQIWKDGKKIK